MPAEGMQWLPRSEVLTFEEIERDHGIPHSTAHRYALEYLGDLADESLGGLVMIQVVEHLPPQGVIDVVRLAADKVRPGGRVVFETVTLRVVSTGAATVPIATL